MSPQIVVTANEIASQGGIPTGTGAAFVAGACDAGPPTTGPAYVKCLSINDYIAAFGPRSSTSATLYDWLDEFFFDGAPAATAFVTRVTDSTATTATLTLNDGLPTPKPTVVVTAATPGAEGNFTFATVTTGTNATFTATTATSTALTAISSLKNIGPGTPISGTGIPAGTYIVSVNTGASSAVLSQATTASASGVVITPGTITVTITVEDSAGNIITTETHGPYYLTSQLYADTSSAWVTFSQSAATGFTVNLPAALAITPLAGGANASALTDASHVAALANFPSSLGSGSVALPGKTSATAWNGLDAHGIANNRFAIKDMLDNTSAAAVIAAASPAGYTPTSYGMIVQGSLVRPALPGGATRTVPGSAAVAALRAQVAVTSNQNQMPCGKNWPLDGPQGFTTSYGPAITPGGTPGTFSETDVDSLWAAGVNCFANFYGVPCLYGFFTPIPKTTDPIYWQASCSVERMNLIGLGKAILANYLFPPILGGTFTALDSDLAAMCLAETSAGALSRILPSGALGQPSDAFAVLTGPPINTGATAQSGQINAQIQARLTPGASHVTLLISVLPITQTVTQPTQ